MLLNFDEATAGLPLGIQGAGLDVAEMEAVVFALVERLVAQLEVAGREPDEYERDHLGKAILCLGTGFWQCAAADAQSACRPISDRLPTFGGGFFEVPGDKSLRELLEKAKVARGR